MKPITGPDLCRKLEQAGGSHHIFIKPGERKIITVPVHGNREIKPGLATKIAKDADLTW